MVVIRLARRGCRNYPFFNLVVADSRCKRDGKFLEKLGYYCAISKSDNPILHVFQERVNFWIARGSSITSSAKKVLKMYRKKSKQAVNAPE